MPTDTHPHTAPASSGPGGSPEFSAAPSLLSAPPLPLRPELAPAEAPLTAAVEAEVARFLRNSKSPRTWRAYESDWADFLRWCGEGRRRALPANAETVRGYLADRAGTLAPSTLGRRMAAIAQIHEASGFDPPTRSLFVGELMKGIWREKGRRPQGEKKPVRVRELREMIGSLPATAIGVRDRALLLLGFAGAFRRSELAALDWEHLDWREEGLVIFVGRSKNDPEGVGLVKGILPATENPALCPVAAMKGWRQLLRLHGLAVAGPLFRQVGRRGKPGILRLSDKAVARTVKATLGRAMAADRLEAKSLLDFSGHSLRAGFCTAAAEAGAEERSIAEQSGHKSMAILRRYIRDGNVLQGSALRKLGL